MSDKSKGTPSEGPSSSSKSQEKDSSHQISSVMDKAQQQVERALQESLVALANQDVNNTDVEDYQRRKIIQTSQLQRESQGILTGREIKTIEEENEGHGTDQRRDIEIKFGSDSNDEQEDELGVALRRVREIPLEEYLGIVKAKIVEEARYVKKQEKAVQSNIRGGMARGKLRNINSDQNFSRQAGSYVQTDWQSLNESEKNRRIEEQFKLIARVNTNDEFATRLHNVATEKDEPLEERFVKKRIHAKHYLKLKRSKLPIEEMDKVSSWSHSDAEANTKPLITRKLQQENKLCRYGATSVDVKALGGEKRDLGQGDPSRIPQVDARSTHLSGMIVRKSKKQQTMTQYDLIPEIIYNSLEIKIRDLIRSLLSPTHYRQQELARQHQDLYLTNQQLDSKLRDCQLNIKKQLNVKDQFDQVNARFEAQNLVLKKMDATLVKFLADNTTQNDKTQASIRVLTSDVKATSKFISKKNDESAKMQAIIGSFKERLMEKYAVLADEYTETFKKIEHRHLSLMETITSLVRRFDSLSQEQVALKVKFQKEASELETIKEAVNGLKSCYKFGPRITLLENQAKSDLIAVTKKYTDMLYENKKNMKRTEALKLFYSMQVEMASQMMDPVKHRSGLKPTHKHPKLATEVQAKINLLEWQIKFIEDKPFEEKNVLATMNRYQTDALQTNTKQMRKSILLLQLNNPKIGRRIDRATSLPQTLLKRQKFQPLEMPPEKKLNVDFGLVNVSIAGLTGTASPNSSIASPKSSSLHSKSKKGNAKMTAKDKLRLKNLTEILQPGKIRQIVRLSKLRRSSSSKLFHRVKPTIQNLFNDSNMSRPNFLQRLKSTMTNDSKRSETKQNQRKPTRPVKERRTVSKDQNKFLSKDQEPKKDKRKRKSPKGRGQSRLKAPPVDYQQLTSSNVILSHPPDGLISTSPRAPTRSPNEPHQVQYSPAPVSPPIVNAGNLLFMVAEETKYENNQQVNLNFADGSVAIPSAFSPAATTNNLSGKVQNMPDAVSKMMSSYYSQQTSQDEEIASAFYEEFVQRDDLDNQLEDFGIEIRDQIMRETRQLIAETTTQLAEHNTEMVTQAQISIVEVLQEQLNASQESIKAYLNSELAGVTRTVDRIQKEILPSTLAKINASLEETKQKTSDSLKQTTSWVELQIKHFQEKVDYFETEVKVIMTKFKRLVSDQDIFKARVEKIQKRTQEMVKVMRSEQLASSKITSTLVELEFVQQSLDFQDEFDKTQMNLYGLNDLNMTLEEFIAKSSEIASRKLRHEAMSKASELELAKIGESAKQNLTDLTDSGTYQAITMGEDWPSHMGNDNFNKQILQAFKLACVYYKPSPVIYRGHSYNRRSLIEAKRQILDADWQMLSKFQPFKRLWGENSGVDFYEQFARKIHTLIKGFEKGVDMSNFTAQLAEDTFIKICEGTNINQLKQRRGNFSDEDLLSSDYDANEGHRMQAARETDYPYPQNVSSRIHITDDQATQQSSRMKNKSNDTREVSKLQNSARNHRAIEVIKNHNKKSPGDGVHTIEEKTRSMIEAIQGKSVFGPSFEESIFSSEAEKTNLPNMQKNKAAGQSKKQRQLNRSVQKDENQNEIGIFGEFLHAPFWMNQSQVIYENHQQSYLASDSGACRQKAPESSQKSQITAQIRRKPSPKSTSRNERKVQYATEKSPRQRGQKMQSENPNMFEMRPLIGKEQFRKSQSKLVSQGTNSVNREREMGNGNDYDMRLVKGSTKVTKFTMSPWTRPGQFGQSRQPDLNPTRLSIEMKVVGINKDLEFSKANRNLAETFHKATETTSQKPLNFPLNLPIQTINMSLNSPITANESVQKGTTSSGSQSVLTLPKVRSQAQHLAAKSQKYGEPTIQLPLSGNLGSGQQTSQSYESLAESRFNVNSVENKEKKKPNKMVELTKQTEGMVSATSLLWTHEDDMGNKMQAKLAPTSSNPDLQKLRDIARQKKSILIHLEQNPSAKRE